MTAPLWIYREAVTACSVGHIVRRGESVKYNSDRCCVTLSVRELCERACRSGDLDSSRYAGADAMLAGADIHRKLQAQAGGFYRPEVSLVLTTEYNGICFEVSGRADGVIRKEEKLTVDEIKCVRSYDFFAPPKEVFLAQMKCYAYFLAVSENRSEIDGRLTYYHTDTGKLRYFHYHFRTEELRAFYMTLLDRVWFLADLAVRQVQTVLPQAAEAVFPYPELREGQEMMIRECFSAIRRKKRLFAEAPTGTGKTISALYPAVRALGKGYAEKIFYLTAKASTGREAYRAAAKLYEAGVHLRTVVISAKEQMCMCSAGLSGGAGRNHCNAHDCEFARGYYDRVENALTELIREGNGYPRQRIAEVAQKYRVCPYELSLDLSELCDIVICDYNYAFDPTVYFRRYFGDVPHADYIFLVDEAHNLVDRARGMYSYELTRHDFEQAFVAIPETDTEPGKIVESAGSAFGVLRRLCREVMTKDEEGREQGYYAGKQIPKGFYEAMERFRQQTDALLKKRRNDPALDPLAELMLKVRKFLTVSEFFDSGFLFYAEVYGENVRAKICCLDPSHIMNSLLERASSVILFSATLTPVHYFREVLGGSKKAECLSVPSPFPEENLCVAVADYLSTRYEHRKKNATHYATVIAASVAPRKGNYMVYFPSYACLEEVQKVFVRRYPKVELVVQKPDMGWRDREKFLSAFRENTERLCIGFCVLGGVFSEGVDLPGSRLIGSVILGVGLPGLSSERNMIRDYLDGDTVSGYDYAYTFPGMNNVLQAAGRVIRRGSDRGIVVLVDDRYAQPKYRALFPEHWKGIQYAGNPESLAEIIRRFWDSSE